MGVGVAGVVNYCNTSSGTASDVVAYGGVGGPYEYCSFFSVLNWFAAGEQGAWYDPSDLTTLFQNSVGTTPMSAVGTVADQPVGLMLDKSKDLALGAELVVNPDFTTDTWWSKDAGVTISGGTANWIATATTFQIYRTSFLTVGAYYEITFTITSITLGGLRANVGSNLGTVRTVAGTYTERLTATSSATFGVYSSGASTTASVDNVSVKLVQGNHAFQATAGNRPMLSARANILLATATLSTQSVTSLATNYTLAFTGAGTVTLSGTATGVLSAGSNTFTATAGTLTLTVSGSVTLADLRPTNSGALLPAYQRVNTASDYDTVGFPLYLKCNGTSSAMSTNSIDFSSTDKMTVVTGVRKLSDAAKSYLLELSATSDINNGSFALTAPNSAAANYAWLSKGTIADTLIATTYTAPLNNVVTGLANISGATNTLRVNGIATSDTNTQGTGVYANYPLYLFTRSATVPTVAYNFYGAIIRGAQSDTTSVIQTEQYMATKTGITF